MMRAGEGHAVQDLSRSIACTRKSLKNQGWCNDIFLTSDPHVPKRNILTVILTVKDFLAIPAPGNTVN